jgi:hypothetical protein
MEEKIKNLTNLLEEFDNYREQETLSNILEELSSISVSEKDIPVPQKKMLACAEMSLSMVIKANKHPKIIVNNLKRLINVLEDIRIEKEVCVA